VRDARAALATATLFDQVALDPVALAAKERDGLAALVRDFDVVDAGAAGELALAAPALSASRPDAPGP
jgi:hypothetical protein